MRCKMTKPGQRVFAVLRANDEEVYLIGKGVYVGDSPRPHYDAGPDDYLEKVIRESDKYWHDPARIEMIRQSNGDEAAEKLIEANEIDAATPMHERIAKLREVAASNPKIQLDSGAVVWGEECWFGPEEDFEKWLDGRKVVQVETWPSRQKPLT